MSCPTTPVHCGSSGFCYPARALGYHIGRIFQYITTVLWAPTQSDEGSHPVLHDWARPRVVLATRPVHTRCKSSGHSMRTRLWGVAAPSTQEFWAAFSSRREQESNRARRLQGSAPLPSRCTQLPKSSDFKFSASSHTLTNIVLTHPTQRGRTWITALQHYWNWMQIRSKRDSDHCSRLLELHLDVAQSLGWES